MITQLGIEILNYMHRRKIKAMTRFEMVKYHNQIYPEGIPLRIEEIAAHLDATVVNATLGRSYAMDELIIMRMLNYDLGKYALARI